MPTLLADFYQVQRIEALEENAYTISLTLNADHPIFDGHFPHQPVTPGVCVIQIVKEITEKIVDKTLFFQQVKQAKFSSLIDPKVSNVLRIELTIKTGENNDILIQSQIFYQETISVKLSGVLQILA